MANQPLSDPLLESFAAHVAAGDNAGAAYRAVYAADRPLTRQACHLGGKLRLSYPLVAERVRQIQTQTKALPRRAPVKPNVKFCQVQPLDIPKPTTQPVANKQPTNPREALLRRLWEAVQSASNPEAIAAVKQLRDWLREDEQKAESANISDPAIVARHCAATLNDYANMDSTQRQDYIARVLSALESLGLPRADLLTGLRPPPDPIINDLQQQPVIITAPIIDNPVIDNALQ